MYYNTISEYDISSQKHDAERAMGGIAEALREIDSVRSRAESQMRELKSAQSALDRAIEEKIRDMQRNAGKSSGYSSFGYSSSDGRIKDAQRTMERAISGISDSLSKLSSVKSKAESADRQARGAIGKLTRLCEQLRQQLSEVTKAAQSADKRSDELAHELDNAKRKKARMDAEASSLNRELGETKRKKAKADAAAADLSRELDAAKRKSTLAGMAAAAAAVSAGCSDRRLEEAEREISKLRRKLTEVNRGPAGEVLRLRKVLKARDDKIELLSMMLDAARSGSKSESKKRANPCTDQQANSEEYAELWNDVMEDGVIELDEVQKIKTWLANHQGDNPEFMEMDAWCSAILDNGVVSQCDVQTLYDCSLRLLKSMGAKLAED